MAKVPVHYAKDVLQQSFLRLQRIYHTRSLSICLLG